jgi:hypothetical protein
MRSAIKTIAMKQSNLSLVPKPHLLTKMRSQLNVCYNIERYKLLSNNLKDKFKSKLAVLARTPLKDS